MSRIVRIASTKDKRTQFLLTPLDELGDDPERRRAFREALELYILSMQNDN